MRKSFAELSLIIVGSLFLRSGHVCGYPKRLEYGGNQSGTTNISQVSTFGGGNRFKNLISEIQSTTSQIKETAPSVKDTTIINCVKTFCSETKRGDVSAGRKGVKIVLGNVAPVVPRKERLSSLASVLKVLDNKKTTKENKDGNGYDGFMDKTNGGSIVKSSFDSNNGHKFQTFSTHNLGSSSALELPSESQPMLKPAFAEKVNSNDQATNEKGSSATVKASTPSLKAPTVDGIAKNSHSFSRKVAFGKPDEFLSNVAPTNIRKNANRNGKITQGFKSKAKPQLGNKRQGWRTANHAVGVPITYDSSGPHPLTHGQPPPVHRYGHGAIHLMVPPGGKGAPVRFTPGQELPDFNGMEDRGNTRAFMGPGGVNGPVGGDPIDMPFPGAGNYETQQIPMSMSMPVSMPMPMARNPGAGQMPVYVSLPPKVHHVPGPMSVVDPSFVGSLTGSPMMDPSTLGPPDLGSSRMSPLPMMGHPIVGPPILGPSAIGPPMPGPPIPGPPMMNPPVAGPPIAGPPLLEPSMMENAAVHDDTQPSPVVQQVPVPVPVQSPPRLKHVPFPVPVPVHSPPEVKNVPYPVAVPMRQPPEIHKIFYPVPFREPPRVQKIPVPVFIHPPPEVKKVPVPVRVPSPPQAVPVPVPSPPQVFIHRVPVPVVAPAEDPANSFNYGRVYKRTEIPNQSN